VLRFWCNLENFSPARIFVNALNFSCKSTPSRTLNPQTWSTNTKIVRFPTFVRPCASFYRVRAIFYVFFFGKVGSSRRREKPNLEKYLHVYSRCWPWCF
jgi:hypothetical protein